MGDTECSSWLWCWEVGTYVSVIALSLMGINMAYAWWNAGDHYRLLNRHLRSPTNKRFIPGSLSARSPTASPEPEHQLMTEYPKPLPPNPSLYRRLRARQAAGKSLGSGTKDDPVLVPFSLGVGPSGRIESLEEYISNRRWEEDGRGMKDRGPRFTKLGESKGGKGQTQEEHVRYPRREREREEREGKGGKKRKGTKRKNESDTDLEEVDRRPSKKRTQEEEAASNAKSSRTSTTLKKTRRKRSPASSRSPSPTSSVSSRPTKKKSRRDDPSDSASSSEYSAMDVSEDEPPANLKRKERLDRSPSLEGSETAPLDGRSQFDPNLSDTKRRRKRRKSNASVSEREEVEKEKRKKWEGKRGKKRERELEEDGSFTAEESEREGKRGRKGDREEGEEMDMDVDEEPEVRGRREQTPSPNKGLRKGGEKRRNKRPSMPKRTEWSSVVKDGETLITGEDGRKRKLVEVVEMRKKYALPSDSAFKHKEKMHKVIVEKWLLPEEYERYQEEGKLAWQQADTEDEAMPKVRTMEEKKTPQKSPSPAKSSPGGSTPNKSVVNDLLYSAYGQDPPAFTLYKSTIDLGKGRHRLPATSPKSPAPSKRRGSLGGRKVRIAEDERTVEEVKEVKEKEKEPPKIKVSDFVDKKGEAKLSTSVFSVPVSTAEPKAAPTTSTTPFTSDSSPSISTTGSSGSFLSRLGPSPTVEAPPKPIVPSSIGTSLPKPSEPVKPAEASSNPFGFAKPAANPVTKVTTSGFAFGGPKTTSSSTPPIAAPSTSAFSFGTTEKTAEKAATPAAFNFGASASSDKGKGKEQATVPTTVPSVASSPFQFASTSSNFAFGKASSTPTPTNEAPPPAPPLVTASKPSFSFGAATTAPPGATPAVPAFGTSASATTTSVFGLSNPDAAPATTSTTSVAFGVSPATSAFGSGGSAFGKANPPAANTGIAEQTKPTSAFSFGGSGTSTPVPSPLTFGSTASKPSTSAFGSTLGVGTASSSETIKPSSDSKSNTPSITFGAAGTSAPSATPAFAFGSTTPKPANPAFGSGTSAAIPTFGASAPSFGVSNTSTPAFGASATTAGTTSSSAFSTTSAFGGTNASPSTTAFGTSAKPSPFGSTGAPAFSFGSGGTNPWGKKEEEKK